MKIAFEIFLMIFLLSFFVIGGCSSKIIDLDPEGGSVCDTLAEDDYSLICEMAEMRETTPEAIGKILQIENTAGLGFELYEATEARDFVDEIRQKLLAAQKSGGITPAAVIKYANEKYNFLPGKVKAAFTVVTKLTGVDVSLLSHEFLSDRDIEMLLTHLDDQDAVITLMDL